MSTVNRFAEIAALAGEPARAAMLDALMDGRALTAAELARHAGVTAQTASGHLSRLLRADLVAVTAQGRHRYYSLASAAVAGMMEAIMQVAAADMRRPLPRLGPRDKRLRAARTCYDHLAGRLGVGLADALKAKGLVTLDHDGGALPPHGLALLSEIGVLDAASTASRAAPLCRPCLDWSERRPHIAGRLGRALCAWVLDRGWVRRIEGTRALVVTPRGWAGFRDTFGVEPEVLKGVPDR